MMTRVHWRKRPDCRSGARLAPARDRLSSAWTVSRAPPWRQLYPELGVVHHTAEFGNGVGGLVLRLVPRHCVQQAMVINQQLHPRQ